MTSDRPEPPGFALAGFDVNEIDATSRICRIVTFDESQFADAIDEMEDRYRQLSGDAYTWVDGLGADGERALNHRDFATFESMLAEEFTIEDHQQFGMPMTKDSYLASMRVLIDQTPDFAFVFAKGYVAGNASLNVVPFTGATPEGSRYEWRYVQLARIDADGRALRFEFFPEERWDDAVALFDEWVAGHGVACGAGPARVRGVRGTRLGVVPQSCRAGR